MTYPGDDLSDLAVPPDRALLSQLLAAADTARILADVVRYAGDLVDSADTYPIAPRRIVGEQILKLVAVPEASEDQTGCRNLLRKLATYTDSLVEQTMMVQMDPELASMHQEISREVTAALSQTDDAEATDPAYNTLDLAQKAYQAAGRAYCIARFNYSPESYVQGQAGADKHIDRDAESMVHENWFRAVVDAVLNIALETKSS